MAGGVSAPSDTRLRLGYAHVACDDVGKSTQLQRNEAVVDLAVDHGLLAKPGYTYRRSFDYFAFRIVANNTHAVDNIATRGLLFGTTGQLWLPNDVALQGSRPCWVSATRQPACCASAARTRSR